MALVLAVAVTTVLAACGGTAPPAPATGAPAVLNCGVSVPVRTPTKIFAAFHNAIEVVYALGRGDRLVGAAYLDNTILPRFAAQFSPAAQHPAYFPEEYPSREEVLRLDPDFVVSGFTGAYTTEGLGTRAELAGLGIDSYLFTQYCPTADGAGQTSLAANAVTLDSVYGDITELGRLLGAEDEAATTIAAMKAAAADVTTRLTGVANRPTVAMVNRPGGGDLRVFGTGDIATTIIEAAGGTQAFPNVAGRLLRVGTEELIARNPDVIIVPACCDAAMGPEGADAMIAALKADKALANVPAVRHNRVHAVTFAEVTPGVRNADAIANLARLLHPEKF